MKRFFYQILIGSHPRRFRERFGDEMLYIFDESAGDASLGLLADGFLSLVRQRIVRSNLWKLGVGAAVSTLLLFVWA